MAKSKLGLIIGISAGVLALGTGAFFILRKKDGSTTGSGSGSGSSTGSDSGSSSLLQTVQNAGSTLFGMGQNALANAPKYKVAYIAERLADKQIVVNFAAPRPPAETVPKGKRVQLSNMGKYDGIYKVQFTWTDTAGNQGAIYLNSDKVTQDNNDNRSMANVGVVTVLI